MACRQVALADAHPEIRDRIAARRHAAIFWAQELLPAVLLWTVLQLASAGIFTLTQDGLDFGTAFYHCCTTAATVGYGDVPMETQASRAFASVHILVSVSWLAALFAVVEQCSVYRKAVLARAALLTRPLARERVVALDHTGKGVDKLEFVIGMLQILGVQLCGEELRWDDVRPFILKFDELDKLHRGRIDKRTLEKYYDEDLATESQIRVQQLGWSTRSLEIAEAHYDSVMLQTEFIASRLCQAKAAAARHRGWRALQTQAQGSQRRYRQEPRRIHPQPSSGDCESTAAGCEVETLPNDFRSPRLVEGASP